MSNQNYKITRLKNGLRVMTIPQPTSLSATVMMMVSVGSRQELPGEEGVAHFIEHNVFKGTKTRTKRNQIAEEIEGLGGVNNAATGHEMTYYWAKVASSQIQKVTDIILDISTNMTFPKEDLEIERGNVIEEINMYEDNPMQRVMRDYMEHVWDNHPVGRRIIGTKESVSALTQEKMVDFVQRQYLPGRMLLVVAGGINEQAIIKQAEDYYSSQVKTDLALPDYVKFEEFQSEPRVFIDSDDTQQTHFCIGFKTFGRFDKRVETLGLLNAVLGQGMSSRLFRRIREELGLAYYIGSMNWESEETGVWFARAGVDNLRSDQAIEAVLAEFKRLADELVPENELRKAKEYLKGKTVIGVETSDDLASWYGGQELLEKEVLSPDEFNVRIENITATHLQELAKELLREDRLNLALVGPGKTLEDLQSKLKL